MVRIIDNGLKVGASFDGDNYSRAMSEARARRLGQQEYKGQTGNGLFAVTLIAGLALIFGVFLVVG